MGNLLFKFQRTKHMKFLAVLALINVSQAAECLVDATDNGDGTGVNADASDCEVPECVGEATENASGGPCTAAAPADPARTAAATCTEDEVPVCTEADETVCTGPVPEAADPACTADAVEGEDGAWAEADGTACTAADAGEGDDGDAGDADLSSLSCETAEDCEGDDMVCAETSLDSVDQEHEAWTAEAEEIATSFLPLKACITSADCEQAVTDAGESEEFYKLSVSCGATKLVAVFAALALASAM